jgi:hypothetical protein
LLGDRCDGAWARVAPQPRAEVGDPRDGGVLDRAPAHLIGLDAAQVRLEHPHGAAVRDDQHVPGAVIIGRARELVDELGGSRVQGAHGFAAGRPRVRIGYPAAVQAGHGRADRRRGETLEHAERPLPQSGVGVDGQPEHCGEGGGGLQRAAQVAGVDRADRSVAELPGGVRRLAQAAVRQLRDVVVPLRQARDVPG